MRVLWRNSRGGFISTIPWGHEGQEMKQSSHSQARKLNNDSCDDRGSYGHTKTTLSISQDPWAAMSIVSLSHCLIVSLWWFHPERNVCVCLCASAHVCEIFPCGWLSVFEHTWILDQISDGTNQPPAAAAFLWLMELVWLLCNVIHAHFKQSEKNVAFMSETRADEEGQKHTDVFTAQISTSSLVSQPGFTGDVNIFEMDYFRIRSFCHCTRNTKKLEQLWSAVILNRI